MVKEEVWSVSLQRVRSFFREQPDVIREGEDGFRFGTCCIRLAKLPPHGTGIWEAPRTMLRLEGSDGDVQTIYRRFFLQFLSTGG